MLFHPRVLLALLATLLLLLLVATTGASAAAAASTPFRPPAVPLFTFTPTTSVWCANDQFPNCTSMQHWSGSQLTWTMLVRIDQQTTYSLMGFPLSNTTKVQLATQNLVTIQPLQTIIDFQTGPVNVTVTFLQSSIPDNLEWYSRPVVYVRMDVSSNDNNAHDVQVYLEQGVDFVVNDLNSNVVWTDVSSSFSLPSARALRMNSYRQIAFDLVGDGVHNDWGFSYLVGTTSTPTTKLTSTQASSADARAAFTAGAPLPAWDARQPRQANDDLVSSVLVYDFGSVAPNAPGSEFAMFAYDEVESMFFFHEVDVPLWRHTYNNDAVALLTQSYNDYETILSTAALFDANLMARLQIAGGDEYMLTSSLVFRQVTGATVTTWNTRRNMAWAYMKEMSSDGDVSTVDVLYPAAPLFLMQSPELLRLMLLPVLEYGNNATDISYGFNWAPHHLGTWPVADITQFQQENMPMEESANLLMMLSAIAMRQNGSVSYLEPYWPLLETWALYLNSTLPDPPNQLCTDDFEGPSPHNANLALKGIIGLAAYAQLRGYAGDSSDSKYYMSQAQTFIADWMQLADDGDHYRLQYNLPNTFSIKYNLAWHTLLGLDVVPASVGTLEAAYYQKQRQAYGPPLDSRSDLALTVWLSMAGCFSTAEQAANVHHDLYEYVVSTPDRIPLSDVYHVASAQVIMFRARSVQGGFYAYALCTEQAEWKARQNQPQVSQQVSEPASKPWTFATL